MEEPIEKPRRRFHTDALIYGLGGVLSQVVGILLLPLYTRFLAPSDFGVMELIERVGNIMNICLMTGGIGQAAMAFYLQAKSRAERERVAVTVSLLLLICFVLAGSLTMALASKLSAWLEISDPWLLIFGVVTVLTQLSLMVPFTLMQARVESIAYVSLSLIINVIRMGLAILFVVYFGWGLKGVYWSILLTSGGFGILLTLRELRRGSLHVDWHKCVEIARFSAPFIPTGILMFLLQSGDRFFLVGTAGTAAVGLYSLGAKLAGGVGIVTIIPLFKVWSARMYVELERPGGGEYGGRMLTQMLVAYSFVGLGLCLFHPELLAIVSTTQYTGAGSVIAPLVLAGAFMFISTFMECAFYVRRRTILKPFTALASTVLTLALYAALIPRYGIHGAAYATLLGYAATAAITYAVAQRVLMINYQVWKIAMLIGLSVFFYLPSAFVGIGLWEFSAKLCLLFAWLAAICACGIVRIEDVRNKLVFPARRTSELLD